MNSGKHSQNFNFVGNATFICYYHSHIFKYFLFCDGFVCWLFDFVMHYGDER